MVSGELPLSLAMRVQTPYILYFLAPTGSGKTVIFELAILKVVMNKQFHSGEGRSLCVYMAPLKVKRWKGS